MSTVPFLFYTLFLPKNGIVLSKQSSSTMRRGTTGTQNGACLFCLFVCVCLCVPGNVVHFPVPGAGWLGQSHLYVSPVVSLGSGGWMGRGNTSTLILTQSHPAELTHTHTHTESVLHRSVVVVVVFLPPPPLPQITGSPLAEHVQNKFRPFWVWRRCLPALLLSHTTLTGKKTTHTHAREQKDVDDWGRGLGGGRCWTEREDQR